MSSSQRLKRRSKSTTDLRSIADRPPIKVVTLRLPQQIRNDQNNKKNENKPAVASANRNSPPRKAVRSDKPTSTVTKAVLGTKRPLSTKSNDGDGQPKAKVQKKIPDWDYKGRYYQLNEKYMSAQDLIKEQKLQIDEFSAKCEELTTKNEEFSERNKKLDTELGRYYQLNEKYMSAQDLIKEQKLQIDEFDDELSAKCEELITKNEELSERNKKLDTELGRYYQLNEKYMSAQDLIKEQKLQIDEFDDELSAKCEELITKNEELSERNKKLDTELGRYYQLNEKYMSAQDLIKEQKLQIDEFDELSAKCEELFAKCEELTTKNEEFSERNKKLDTELGRYYQLNEKYMSAQDLIKEQILQIDDLMNFRQNVKNFRQNVKN